MKEPGCNTIKVNGRSTAVGLVSRGSTKVRLLWQKHHDSNNTLNQWLDCSKQWRSRGQLSCFLSKDATQININIFCRCKVSSFLNKVKIFPKRAPDLLALERLMSVSLVQVCLELSIFIIMSTRFLDLIRFQDMIRFKYLDLDQTWLGPDLTWTRPDLDQSWPGPWPGPGPDLNNKSHSMSCLKPPLKSPLSPPPSPLQVLLKHHLKTPQLKVIHEFAITVVEWIRRSHCCEAGKSSRVRVRDSTLSSWVGAGKAHGTL